VLEHFRVHLDFVGDEIGAVRSFRKHLAWYAHGLRGASAFRNEVNRMDHASQVDLAVRRFFAEADRDDSEGGEQDLDYRTALG
jgi:tRNA-dihydrouridine synthase